MRRSIARYVHRLVWGVLLFVATTHGTRCCADWPQILGAGRDGRVREPSEELWKTTPRIAWQVDCGSGYAGAAIVDGKVYLPHRVENSECLDCLDARDGTRNWRASFPANYHGGYNDDHGPRCVPVVDRQRVFLYGAAGDLRCVDANTGKTLWQRRLRVDYDAEDGYFGAASTPIVQGDVIVVAVGGTDGAGVLGLDVGTGETRWKATDLEADYASPIALDAQRVVVPMRMQTVAINTGDGSIDWRIDFGQRGLNVIGATPTLAGQHLFLTASYRIGAQLVDLGQTKPSIVWQSDEILSSQYNTAIVAGKHLMGIHGREDGQPGELRCVELLTGKVKWQQPDFGVSHLLGMDKRMIALHIDGKVDLLGTDPEKFVLLETIALPNGVYRALPAVSGGLLFCRKSARETSKLIALDLRAASSQQGK